MPNKTEIVMETTHGRKEKCKTEFKAVINKVLVSGLILATLMTSTITPVMAATDFSAALNNNGISYTQQYGISVEQSISEIRNTIAAINEMKAKGSVTDAMLQKLESQIYALSQAVNYSNEVDLTTVNNILNDAELAVKGVKGNTDVKVAISVARAMLSPDGMGSAGHYDYKQEYEESHTVNQAEATPMVSSFWDVKPNNWYYDSVMKMTKMGYFAGKGTNANGEATFAPNDTMTRAEFMTVVARILYDEDNLKGIEGDEWWSVYYNALISGGIITPDEFSSKDLNQPMSRQEMAMVSMRALNARGEYAGDFYKYNVEASIPDSKEIGNKYKEYVLEAYSMGILAGKSGGRFDAKGTLLRSEATTVLYRIVDKSVREKVDFSTGAIDENKQYTSNGLPSINPNNGFAVPEELVNSTSTAPITIYEGQVRSNRPAKAGDTFVKKDGTQIILQKDQYGIVGGGQGVAPDIGLFYNGNTCSKNGTMTYDGLSGALLWTDSTGANINNASYSINATTGSGHWSAEWQLLSSKIAKPSYKGSSEGEISKDAYHLYKWDSVMEMWVYNR